MRWPAFIAARGRERAVLETGCSPAARIGLALLAALAALVLRVPELDRYATIDESRWVGRSADFATYIQQRDLDKTSIVGHPGVTTMWLGSLGLGTERIRAFSYLEGQTDVTRREGYLEALVAARRAVVAANALAIGAVIWLGWGLLGPGPALLTGLLMLLDPFLSAHSRLIHLDGLLASFMAAAALAAIAFWGGAGWVYLVGSGLFGGLAFLTKAPSVYLALFVPAVAGFELCRSGNWRSSSGWARLALSLAAWFGINLLVALALWPALWVMPLRVARQITEFTLKNAGGERDNFFLGQPVEDPGLLFYPLALLFRATPLMLLGLVILTYALCRSGARSALFRPAVLLAVYSGGFMLMMSVGQKKFDRYELPIFPALNLLAGLGLWLGWQALSRFRRSPALSLSLLLALAVWPLASVYPYDLAYYNPLLGGGRVAQWALFVGWGEGLDRVAAHLNRKPIALEAPSVASAYHRALQAHLVGNGAMPLERAELADYIVPYVNSMQRDQDSEALAPYIAGQEPEHVVWLNGIEYARVYRGPHLPIDRQVAADFGGRLHLDSIVFAPGSGEARAGDDLLIRLRWRPFGDPERLVALLRLLTPDNRPILEERQLLNRALREGGLLIVDARLALPSTLGPGRYRLQVMVDDTSSGAHLTGVAGEGAVMLQEVNVWPALPR